MAKIQLTVSVRVNVGAEITVEVSQEKLDAFNSGEIDAGELACDLGEVLDVRRTSLPGPRDIQEAMGADFDSVVYALEALADD